MLLAWRSWWTNSQIESDLKKNIILMWRHCNADTMIPKKCSHSCRSCFVEFVIISYLSTWPMITMLNQTTLSQFIQLPFIYEIYLKYESRYITLLNPYLGDIASLKATKQCTKFVNLEIWGELTSDHCSWDNPQRDIYLQNLANSWVILEHDVCNM